MITLILMVGAFIVTFIVIFQSVRYADMFGVAASAFLLSSMLLLVPFSVQLDGTLSKMNEVSDSDLKNVSPETAESLKVDGIHPLSRMGMLRTLRDDTHRLRVLEDKAVEDKKPEVK